MRVELPGGKANGGLGSWTTGATAPLLQPGRRRENEAERRLMLAVIEDAILCYQKNVSARGQRGQRLFREAEGWIMGEARGSVVSFERACAAVGLDPDYLRCGLLRWRERQGAVLSGR